MPTPSRGIMAPPKTVFDLLDRALTCSPQNGITSYPEGDTIIGRSLRYPHLKVAAKTRARLLQAHSDFSPNAVIVLHFDDHLENILWYWAVLYAGCTPALSTPLPNDIDQRTLHLDHLHRLFENPLWLTNARFIDQLSVHSSLRLADIQQFKETDGLPDLQLHDAAPEDIAALMLTSGSTGNAKAVCLTHQQILTSVAGKNTIVELPSNTAFLNWVGVDHVAALLETHFAALHMGYEQIHVQAVDVVASPTRFLELLSNHRVSRTFAPNFFLASIIREASTREADALKCIDLSSLRCVVSGGEANPIRTCEAISRLFVRHGAPDGVLFPAFGMTETCAGSIYNRGFSVCASSEYNYAALGHCVPGIKMRIVHKDGTSQATYSPGNLEVKGPIIFQKYYRNEKATAEAFTHDGWFDTGDEAVIDSSGALNIIGRAKDVICVNGVKLIPSDIEAGLNAAEIPGAVRNYFVCFSHRSLNEDTEQLCIAYLPAFKEEDIDARSTTAQLIVKKVMLQTGVFPDLLPVDTQVLKKTTLGKLSRKKIQAAFINGDLKKYQDINSYWIEKAQQERSSSQPLGEKGTALLEAVRDTLVASLGCEAHSIGPDTPLLEVGMTSMHIIAIKKAIEVKLDKDVSIAALMQHPTVRLLAAALDLPSDETYDPVVKLQSHGSGTPLWLFHPGVGEVLVFLGLSAHIEDRPVYALRARGFVPGEPFFASIEETVQTYYHAMRRHQPKGPYALAGYSYGSMLAFETAKLLQNSDDPQEVNFLGSFNLPPHIQMRMKQLNWQECLLHLGFFLNLFPESEVESMRAKVQEQDEASSVRTLIQAADSERVAQLGLTDEAFLNWTNLSYGLQSMASDYQPSGNVPSMDVFYCQPLQVVASSKQEWLDKHLTHWADFASDVQYHEVEGSHYTMIGTDHISSFFDTFQHALAAREIAA